MAVFDTNIVIDYLNGCLPARRELEAVRKPVVSIVTWMEVLAGIPEELRARVEEFFADTCEVVPVTKEVASHAIHFRREMRLKLLDAVVLATAYLRNEILVTRDKGFAVAGPLVRVPYAIME